MVNTVELQWLEPRYGSFTMDGRTRSCVRKDFLQIRYTYNLGRFSSFILQMYAVCTH